MVIMTGEYQSPEGNEPEFDPIKDAFVEDGISDLLNPADNDESTGDPIDDLLRRGLISEEDAEARRKIRDMEPGEKEEALESAAGFMHDLASYQDSPLGQHFGEYFDAWMRHQRETDGEGDFVPLKYFESSVSGSDGKMTIEEWQQLPDSTKDTLRDVRFDGNE
ncbi:hypothetical protein KC867_03425 [Candidatus Saccharibacteria bacterium]|nr:hypothetical protein [Candidatus Saccharibacteria bacterium]